MKNKIFKISIYIVFLISALLVSPTKAKAADMDFTFNAYTCQDLEGATTNSAKRTAATNCITKYLNGQLSSIPAGSDLSPGASIMVTLDFVNNNPDKLGATFNLHASYDNTNITAFAGTSSLYKTSQYYLKSSNPVFDEFYEFWTETIQTSDEDGRISSTLQSTATVADDVAPFFTEEGTLLYLFFTVKDTATAGASIDIGLIESGSRKSKISTFDSVEVTHTQTPISLRVAGDSLSTDSSLKSITVKGNNNLNYESQLNFTAGDSRRTYELVVPNGVSSIDLSLATNFDKAQIMGIQSSPQTGSASNTYNLNVGDNTIEFNVQAEDQNTSVEHYVIKIKRLSNDSSLSNLTITDSSSNNIGGSLSGTTYTGSVLYAISNVNVAATASDSNATIVSGTGNVLLNNYVKTGNSGLNSSNVVVEAEDCKSEYASVAGNSCTSTTYAINITRQAPSKTNTLSDIKIDGTSLTSFDKDTLTYTYGTMGGSGNIPYGVPANKESVNITATLGDPLGEIVSGTGECTLQVGANTCEIEVKAEDPDVANKTYSISIYRLSGNAKLNSLSLTPYVGTTANASLGTLSPAFSGDFNSTTGEYTYSYEPTVTKILLSASVADIVSNVSKAYISLTDISDGGNTLLANGTNGSISDIELLPTIKKVQLTVTAEDGSVLIYPINLVRAKSSDTTLKELSVSKDSNSYTLSPTFVPSDGSKRTYSVTVPPEVTSVDVQALATSDYAKSVTVTGNSGFTFDGPNTIKVTVVAENDASADYTINVTRQKYTESDLTGLSAIIDSSEYITDFSPTKYEYTINVPYDKTSVDISATTNLDYYINVSGDVGRHNLNTGLNTFTVHTESQETDVDRKTTKDYVIKITRAKNSDTQINTLKVVVDNNGTKEEITATCDHDTLICTLPSFVPNSFTQADSNNVKVTLNDPALNESERATASVTTTPIYTTNADNSVKNNEVYINVTAEDNTYTATYTLIINRTKSNIKKLNKVSVTPYEDTTALTLKECNFEGTNTSCTINVPVNTTKFTIAGTLQDPKSNVAFTKQGEATSASTFDMADSDSVMTLIATVTAEDGTTNLYTITINRDKSSNNRLSTIETNANGSWAEISNFSELTTEYTISVPSQTTNFDIKAVASDSKSVITVTGATDTNSAQDEILVNKTLLHGTTINTEHPDNTVVITVTAENNEPKIYTIHIIRKYNTDATLSDLQVNNTTVNGFNSSQRIYNLDDVSYDVTSLDIRAITNDPNAKVSAIKVNGTSVSVTAGNDVTKNVNLKTGANSIVLTVKSHDEVASNDKTYTLNINRGYNTDRTITSFVVKWDGVNHNVSCDGEKVCTIDGDLEVPYNFTQADSSNVLISLKDPALNESERASAIVTTTALSTTDDALNQVTNNVPITILSESDRVNGTSGDSYTLKLKRTRNSEKTLSQVNAYINGATTNPKTCALSSLSCEIEVPVNTTTVKLEGILVDTQKSRVGFALIDNPTVVGPTFNFPLTDESGNEVRTLKVNATVTAEDGTTAVYTITINRALSSDNKISELIVTDNEGARYALTPTFDYENNPTQQVFYLTVTDDVTSLNIYAKAHDERTTLGLLDSALSDINSSISILETTKTLVHDVNNEVVITSTAQNNDKINYTINITRLRGTNTKLSNLTYNHAELSSPVSITSGLDANPYTLDLGTVKYQTTQIDLSAIMEDARGAIDSVTVNDVEVDVSENSGTYSATAVLDTGDNTIVITTKAHDTTKSKTYTLTVERELNNDSSIKDIEVLGVDDKAYCTDEVDAETGKKICRLASGNPVTVPYNFTVADENKITVNVNDGALPTDALATVEITGTTLLTTDDDLNKYLNKVPIKVTAEDNSYTEYVLYMYRKMSTDTTMTRVNVSINNSGIVDNYCLLENGATTCRITVPTTTRSFTLDGILSDAPKSRVSFALKDDSSVVGPTFAMPDSDADSIKVIEGIVTAEDGTVKTYTITVERTLSNNSFLKDIKTNAKQAVSTNLVSIPDFEQATTNYTVEVLGTQSSLTLEATAFDPKAKVTIDGETIENPTDKVNYTKTLNEPGTDTIVKIVVTPEDGTTPRIYTLTIKRLSNTDPLLSMIYINNQSINDFMSDQTFSSDVDEYILDEVPYNTYNISVTADNTDDTYGTVKINDQAEGSGVSVDLQTKYYGKTYPVSASEEYTNVITVTGIAHDGTTTKDYVIKVKRTPNDKTTISKVEMLIDGTRKEATCDLINYKCTITVPNSVKVANSSNVIVTPTNGALSTDALATITMNETNLSTTAINNHTFTVTAEDGTHTRDYTLAITREKSNNAKLKELYVYDIYGNNVIGSFNPSFDPTKSNENQVYTVTVPDGTSEFKVVAVRDEENAIVTGASLEASTSDTRGDTTLVSSTKTVVVTSRSEDNSETITYTLNIVRTPNADYKLGSISIKDQEGNEYSSAITPDITNGIPNDTTEFNVTVPSSVTELTFLTTPNNSLGSISYGTGTNITSPTDVDLDNDASTYDAKYTVVSNNTYRMEVIVTSESGAPKPYYINVTVSPKEDNTLKSLIYNYPSENAVELITEDTINQREFDLGTVENTVTKINISAIVNDPTATISGDVGEQNLTTSDDGNTFTIIVTAENGDIENYSIKVKRKKSDTATLDSLNIANVVFNEAFAKETFNYTATVSETRDLIAQSEVTYTKSSSNSVVTLDPNLTMNASGNYTYEIKVTAEDGITTNTYRITITKPKSTNDYLESVVTDVGTLEPTFDKTNQSYTIKLPQNSTSLTITGTPEVTSATVTGNGTYPNLVEGQQITLSVQAEVGSTEKLPRVYTFTVKFEKSDKATLDELSVSGYPFAEGAFDKNSSRTSYTLQNSVPKTTDQLHVNAKATNTEATIYYYKNTRSTENEVTSCRGLEACDIDINTNVGDGYILVYVKAADAIHDKEYLIKYTKVRSNNSYLNSITTTEGTLSPTFNSATQNYTIDLAATVESLSLTFTAEDDASSLSYVGGGLSQLSTLTIPINDIAEGGTKTISVSVTPEDQSDPRIYTVVINRAVHTGSNDTSIDSIIVMGDGVNYPVVPSVAPGLTIYDIGTIPYSLTELDVLVTAHDSNARVKYAGPGEEYHDSTLVTIPKVNGNNSISIQVRAEDGTTKDYVVTYNKQADDNNFLSDLSVTPGTLNNAFDKNLGNYEVVEHLDANTDEIIIRAVKESPNATITINGEEYTSGTNKTIQGLNPGRNTISIVVKAESESIKTYQVVVIRDSNLEQITSEQFGHTIADGYIKTVADLQTVTDLKNQLDNDNSKLQVWSADNTTMLGDSDRVGTGMIVKLFVNNVMTDSKIVIVLGDTTGDGKLNMNDVSRIINHYLGRSLLVDAQLVAADVDKNSKVNMTDVSRVINHYLSRASIVFK